MEKFFCALSDQLDWTNPEGYDRPIDMSKPLPLQEKEGRLIIPIEVLFNNNLDYLKGDKAKRTYSSSITKTPTSSSWDKELETTKTIVLQSHDQQEVQSCCLLKNENPECYLHLNDIEDMLLLLTQNMLFNLDRDVIVHLGVALRMFTRGIVLQSRVEDVQLGVQTYQRKLNLIIPQRSCPGMSAKELYTPNYDPQGVIYEDKKNRKILMWVDELHKFSEWSLQSVHKTLLHRLKNFRLGYNPNLICRGGNRQTRVRNTQDMY
ncbi:hypothetical protein Tco_0398426 [Tanacetum coccineum]